MTSTQDRPEVFSTPGGQERGRKVRRLFSEIAPRYDLLNHVLSMNVDRSWRRKAVNELAWTRRPSGTFLDACAGTFDLSLELALRSGFTGRVVGSDFALPMLVRGLDKLVPARGRVSPLCSDALHMPFPDASFDGATVGFGVRNLADLDAGLMEFRRVLRPGARLVVLEFTTPPNALLRSLYLFYFHQVLPRVGRIVSGHPWAYTYLPESVGHFPAPDELGQRMRSAGFAEARWSLLSGGIAALHVGTA